MKQLLILDRQFNVKKIGLVKTSPTIFDTISPQKTTLELLKDESVDIGNIISIKQYDTQEFLGIVQDVSVKNKTELYVYPFINAFNCECTMESINGYVYDWIVATMNANFVDIADNSLKLNLEFRNMMTLQPSLSYIFSDGNLFEALKKIFYITGVYLEFSLKFVNGIAVAIYCDVYNTNDYALITIRYDNPLLGEEKPVIENSMNYGTNKIILKPEEGASGSTYAFYLLEDNTVTTNQGASGRLTPVNQKIARYAEGTSSAELQLIAEKELLGEAYDHNIYFKIAKNDSYQFGLYRKVKFITADRTYISYCSKIDKTQDNVLGITLGVIRNNLTDKIKDLEAQTSSLSSATSSGSGAIIPVLQWGNIGGSINNQADLKNALAGKIPTTEKGAVNGVATLGADGKLSSTQMPAIRVSDVYVVSSQAEMLALETDEGDVAKRTDLGKSFILNSGSPTILSSWIPMVDDFEPLGAVSDHNASETAHSTLFGGKVDKIEGKGLSTNDLTSELKTAYDGAVTDRHTHSNKTTLDSTTASYTTEEKTKLSGIEANAEVNIIETVKVNGTALTPTEKAVDILAMDLSNPQTANGAKTFGDNLTLSKKLFVGTMQTIYNAEAEDSDFEGSLFFGNGGGSLSHTVNYSGCWNTGIGIDALLSNTSGSNNTAIGFASLKSNISSNNNTAIGFTSLLYNTSGRNNTAIGYNSLKSNTSGSNNTVLGISSLIRSTTGNYNIAIGAYAGEYIINGITANTTPNNSIYLGANTKSLADNQTNQIVIGYNTTGHGSNTATIGNEDITDNYFNGNLHLTGNIQNATNTFILPSSTGTLALTSELFSGVYTDLTSKPKLNTTSATALSTNATETITGTISLHKISKTGTFSDLLSIPTTISGYGITDAVSLTGIATLTNKTLTDPIIGRIKNGTNYLSVPTLSSDEVIATLSDIPSLTNYVTLDGEETLTNKTLTLPKISSISNTGTLTLPTATGTLALTSDIPSVSNFLVASNIKAGTNISLSVSGNDVTINSTASGGTGTVTSVGLTAGTGISVSGGPITSSGTISVGHANILASAQTTQAVYPIKIDKNGHISEYGSAVTVPTKLDDLIRINKQGYIASGNQYFELATLPIDNSGNYASVIFSGRIGGWVGTANVAYFTALLSNRSDYTGNNITASIEMLGKFEGALPIATIVAYKQADLSTKLYLKASSYYTFDFAFQKYQSTVVYNYTGTAVTPTGTLIWDMATAPKFAVDTTGQISNGTYKYTLPSSAGTLALTSQIPVNSSFTLAGLSEKNFSSLANKPTTISGYGITDAVSTAGTQTLSNKTLASPNITTALNLNGHALGSAGGLESIVSVSNGSTSTYIKNASGTIFQSGVIDHGSSAYDWTANITFTGFTNIPRIFACPLEESGSGCTAYVYRTPTKTGATIRQTSKYGAGGKARYVYWFAIGN